MKKLDGWQIPLGMLALFLIGGTIYSILGWLETYPIIAGSLIAGTVAISVGLITFSGVRLTLKHATERMHFELANSRKEAEEERQYAADKAKNERIATMRREVYLQAVENLMEAQNFLSTLPNTASTRLGGYDGLQAFHTSVSKIAVVGEAATVMKARALSVKFARIVQQSSATLGPMAIENGRAAVYDESYVDAQNELKRINTAMTRHIESLAGGEENNARFNALHESAQRQMADSKVAAESALKARQDALAHRRKYYEMFSAELPSLLGSIEEILNEIRRELGLVTDRAGFAAQTAQLLTQMQGAADNAIE